MCVGREMMTMPYDKLEPLASKSPLIVYVDYKSPYAYLAMEPTYALEDELGIEIDWRRHARTGVPVTLITLAITAAWLAVLA